MKNICYEMTQILTTFILFLLEIIEKVSRFHNKNHKQVC